MANPGGLFKHLKIVFSDLDFCDDKRTQTPHDAVLEDVHAIGKTSYNAYEPGIYLESRLKPWRSSMKNRAKYVAECAGRCLDTHQREQAWRMKLEHELTSRFEHEINCTICRAELWRAPKDPTVATGFKTPQRRCQCSPSDKFDNIDDGLSRIFDCHIEEPLEHDESIPVTKEVGRRSAPDRVYGLRKTERLLRLLEETLMPSGDVIGEKVKSTPYSDRSHPLAFPYLILESKSEKSSDSRSDAQSQTAPALITCLEIQARLADAVRAVNPEHPSLQQHPLVWFLCHKGEQWYVAIAFVHHQPRSLHRYRVETIWSGKINLREEALRLLLVMDYIFDWARDVYRKNIMEQILALAANTTTTLAADTDLLSVVGQQYRDISLDFHEDPKEGFEPPKSGHEISQLLQIFDVDRPTRACIRDARFMMREVVGIDITQDSFEEYLRSLSKNKSLEQEQARKLQRALREEHAWLVSAKTLDAIEFLWTGRDREHQDFRSPDDQFLVNFAITSQLVQTDSPEKRGKEHETCWQQIHTLNFVALSVDVIGLVNDKAALRAGKPIAQPSHSVDSSMALPLFEKIRNASVRQCLTSAITSAQMMTSRDQDAEFQDYLDKLTYRAQPPHAYHHCHPCFKMAPPGYSTVELPQAAYNSLKVGQTEPEVSFLRLSSLWHEQKSKGSSGWPHQKKLIDESEQIVFAYAVKQVKKATAREYSHCIFLVDPVGLSSKLHGDSTASKVSPAINVYRIGKGQQSQSQLNTKSNAQSTGPKAQNTKQARNQPKVSDPTPRDFDWFVERLGAELSQMKWSMRRFEDGYHVAEMETLVQRINDIRGYAEGDHLSVKFFVAIGKSYGLRAITKHLRVLTRSCGSPKHNNSGKAKLTTHQQATTTNDSVFATPQRQRSHMEIPEIPPFNGRPGRVDSPPQTPAKRVIVIDDDDDGQPGPSKRPRPNKSPSDEGDVEGSSPSIRSYITIEDEDEDRIVRLSLSGAR